MFKNKIGAASFGTIVAVIGSVLISLGIAWLIAQNWHQFPAAVKIFILLLATSAAFVSGTMLRVKGYPGIAKALLVLGSLLYTLSIFLIAQIFATETTVQGTAWLFLLAWVGVLASAYIFDSPISLIVALVEIIIWLVLQFVAFGVSSGDMVSSGILAFYFLATGVLLYGLSLLHKSAKHKFAAVYRIWTIFYFLAFTYVLSFQAFIPYMWSEESASSTPAVIFLILLVLLSVVSLIAGIARSLKSKNISQKEISVVLATIVVLAILIGITSFAVEDSNNYIFGGGSNAPLVNWAIWIVINIAFIFLILAVIGYGTWQKSTQIINLGIVFFALDIVTRYIGFIMDLWGYTSLAIIFISGGIVLLVGGWFIERWRKNLIAKTRKAK
ncbi:hypothetical protein CMO83_00375 [Candidatus Woesearchaeota archaeon]|jgi:uncharacterized membrane protein|nr:hypothetical protein [Candidatus Woesearchaeota archaeon]MDP6648041.1 DUF2157 domain-containing protein [Candidatus Woesearchaeota archaeon]|tara:strand:- start:36634 stop:37788 length:1155 start_codon:yes stop_codon:yes gene_type:complete